MLDKTHALPPDYPACKLKDMSFMNSLTLAHNLQGMEQPELVFYFSNEHEKSVFSIAYQTFYPLYMHDVISVKFHPVRFTLLAPNKNSHFVLVE